MVKIIVPTVAAVGSSPNWTEKFVEIMDLILPTIAVWLVGFYAFFHCFLNAAAELSCFADRNFYGAWWNSTSLDEFWRLWNIPVYEWCHRHVYSESVYYFGISPLLANVSVFFISASLHELIFS